jgi:ERCC4-type nuclease
MELVCDYREKFITNQLDKMIKTDKYKNISLKKENLHLGDFIIGNMIIERKSHQDLASSILDGRYKEQSNRLYEYIKENPDKKIIYFIEGNFDLYFQNHNIDKDRLISCIMSLFYEKGFFVIMTKHVNETAEFLIKFCIKYYDKYCKNSSENVQCMQTNRKKSSQITKENIGIMMLSNIPNISIHIASQLLEPFKNNIYLFLNKINDDRDYLKDIKIKSKDKERKLSKKIIENIYLLLMD